MVGVTIERNVVDGRIYERAVGSWQDAKGVKQKRRFQLGLYGRDEAVARAREARERGLAQARRELLERQRDEASRRLAQAPPMPRQVKDPRSRKGINMGRRRPRGRK